MIHAEDEWSNIAGIFSLLCMNQHELKEFLDRIPLPIFAMDSEHTVINWNRACEHITGTPASEIVGTREAWRGLYSEKRPVLADLLVDAAPEEEIARLYGGRYSKSDVFPETYLVEDFFLNLGQEGTWLFFSASPLRDEHERIVGAIEILTDITQYKQAEQRIYQLAYFDELTGLPNRMLFHDRLKKAIARCDRKEMCAALLLVDIDRLMAVNDTLGQQAGDKLIVEVGNRISRMVREEDTVARISGDEFMVLVEGIEAAEHVNGLSRRILDEIEQPMDLFGRLIYPEASIGFTLVKDIAESPDELIKQADMAMKGAKLKADKIQGFVEQEDWVSREFHLEHDLKRALNNKEFLVFYQPQIDLQSGRILGLEALLRWNHPERGIVSPGEFIPTLERTGMIAAADEWVIRRVCEQQKNWREEGVFLYVSVNISAHELNNENVVRVIEDALEENGLDPSCLEVELTETEIMDNIHLASSILGKLSSWGVRVALDDFGKGYSSMNYLQQLPISVIKIDKQFVDGLPGNEDAVTLIQTIIAMAHNLGKKALAEGVESEGQARILRELGCNFAQGYLWSRPLPAEELRLK